MSSLLSAEDHRRPIDPSRFICKCDECEVSGQWNVAFVLLLLASHYVHGSILATTEQYKRASNFIGRCVRLLTK